MKTEEGFTLLEVLVALVLVSLVTAGVAPSFLFHLDTVTDNEIRSLAYSAAQIKLDELRVGNPEDLPTSGSDPAEQITVGGKGFQVVASYCANAAYCASIKTRQITVDVNYKGTDVYEVSTIFTELQ